ncbi:MAG: hypothetical protein DSY98_00530 [SAR324 cluster bacterium]|uniref:Glycosyltransferase 61 catalytic domain-containing protein n=1 Tax=SAR324 cluster bacterium TaxID=2024889 RepID=A0A432GI50_9DELT|nr:MAG: hypothetical protein DSY98_00530 [SAR324 cluster bacterium]
MPLILEDALLSAADGLVQSGSKIWFHFQKYPWDLACPEQNPGVGEHRRHIETRLTQGLPDPKLAHVLSGTYHLGISPHIYSYYHLLADLLPHLIASQKFPVLVPEFMPTQFIDLLKKAEFEVQVLSPEFFMVERLLIPEMNFPDWNSEKVKLIQYFFEKIVPLKSLPNSQSSNSEKRIYVSRKLAVKRHLSNEDEFLPLLKKHKFSKIYLEHLSVPEQVQLFRSASHVIAAHGAGLTNILFASADVKILEIRPVLTSGQFCFENLFSLGWPRSEHLVPPLSGEFALPLELLDEVLERWQGEPKT